MIKESIKNVLKKSPTTYRAIVKVYLLMYHRLNQTRGAVAELDDKNLRQYFDTTEVRKLQIGSGEHYLKGWLNSDLSPYNEGIYLNATEKFPLEDNSFDYIYTEHMIEHIPYSDGVNMLAECYRVLKPNGKIRIVTPDLQFLFDLYRTDKTPQQEEYVKWSIDFIPINASFYADTFVINNYVRAWGHQFIYDEKVLKFTLEKAGFINVKRCKVNESEDKEFQNIEFITRIPEGFHELESIVMEATKVSTNTNESN